jgi:MoxR-like ATPase
VLPDDVKKLTVPVMIHRIHVKPEAEMENVKSIDIVNRVLKNVAVPKI